MERANTLASRVLGDGSDCWLVQADPSFGDTANDSDQHSCIKELGLSFAFEHCDLQDDCTYRIYAKLVRWSPGAFDDLISKSADDLLPVPTMWVSAQNGAVFAPYDGGSDLFLKSARDVAELRQEFSTWLSDHPKGL